MLWSADEDDHLYDVLPAKDIAIEGDILGVGEGCKCQANYKGQKYPVTIVGCGKLFA